MHAAAFLVLLGSCSSGLDPDAPPWSPVVATGPGARWGHAAVLDPAHRRMLVFAGQSAGGELADLWALDLGTDTWTELATSGGPATRVNPAAVVDPVRQRMIVFGGRTGATTTFDDVWALDLGTLQWSPLPKGPGPRQRPHYATDGRRAWFYGGEGFLSVFGDLWQYDFASDTWTALPNAGDAPSARTCGAMTVSGNRLIVHGGHDLAVVRDGTWQYDLDAQVWSQVSTEGGTAAGAHWAYALDSDCDTLYLAGGDHLDNYDTAFTDLLPLRTLQFSKLHTSSLPPPRDHATLVFDPANRRLVLYGGSLGDGQSFLGDAWTFSLAACP